MMDKVVVKNTCSTTPTATGHRDHPRHGRGRLRGQHADRTGLRRGDRHQQPNAYTGTSACKRVILRNNKVKGNLTLRIFPEEQKRYDDFLLRIDVAASEGREIILDCQTGTVLSNRPLDAEITPEMATRIRNARKQFNLPS